MNNSNTKDFLHRVLNIDLADFISSIGGKQLEEKNGILTFSSPSQSNKVIKVDTRLNTINDYLTGITNGNILQFGQAFYHCKIPRLLDIIRINYPFKNEETRHPVQVALEKSNYQDDTSLLKVHNRLEQAEYRQLLTSLNISLELGNLRTSAVDFLHRGIPKKGIGFYNNSGGLEVLDTDYQRHRIGPQDITKIGNWSKDVDVFERFEDWLALQNIRDRANGFSDVLVLNSVYAFEQARAVMEKYEQVNLYLQHTELGHQYVGYGQWLDKAKYRDFSTHYAKYRSLSDANKVTGIKNKRVNKKRL